MVYVVIEVLRGYVYCSTKVLKVFLSKESATEYKKTMEAAVADNNLWCYTNGFDEVAHYELIELPLED